MSGTCRHGRRTRKAATASLMAAMILTGVALSGGGLAANPEAGRFAPPAGCTAFLTVQSHGCKVSHHYTCQGDAAGDQWRIDFGEQGPYFLSRIDRETQWVHSIGLIDGFVQDLAPGAPDPASFSALTAEGHDTYDFSQIGSDGSLRRVRGFDALTGETAVIDGVTLERTAFEMHETDAAGVPLGSVQGHEWISRDWRLFFGGVTTEGAGADARTIDRSPVRFDEPGDAGFLSTRPEHDCTLQVSALDAPGRSP